MGAKFGFMATLPQLARFVELDLAVSNHTDPYSVSLIAQNSNGVQLGSQTITVTNFNPEQFHLKVESASTNIAKFVLTTGTSGFNAVDNINAAVPEPSAGIACAAAFLAMSSRGSRRRAQR